MRVIDVHAHFLSKDCFDAVDNEGRQYGPTIVTNEKGEEELVLGGVSSGPIARKTWNPEVRLKDMDAAGVDIQVLSPVPSLMYYNLEPEACLWFSRRQNDGISQTMKECPARFLGMAAVPLQGPTEALAELDRAVNKLGLCGVETLSNINGRQLDDPALEPFYKEAEALDVPIFIHPWGVAGSDRMKRYYLANLIGIPLDTTLAAAHLIFGGILEKFPSLKFCLAHGGGYVPYVRGRWEHGYHVRPECKVIIKHPPSYYLPLLYFETITHYVPALEYLIATVGANRVMLGTDYPYDMSDTQPVLKVRSLKSLSEENRQQILGGNAARLFKL